MKKTLMIICIFALAACAGKPTPIPDADSAGARVFAARCSICHVAPHPKRLTFSAWRHMLTVMESQMQHRGMEPLSEEEREAILAYLKHHAR